MITLGRCPTSNGLLFYNPSNGTIISSIDYTFQYHVTSGSKFGYKCQPGVFKYRLDETTTVYSPQFLLDTDVLVHTHSPPHRAKIVSIPTFSNPDVYTVHFQNGTLAEYSYSSGILEAAPTLGPTNVTTALPDWIKGGVTATLF
jgi:hypothetical protein